MSAPRASRERKVRQASEVYSVAYIITTWRLLILTLASRRKTSIYPRFIRDPTEFHQRSIQDPTKIPSKIHLRSIYDPSTIHQRFTNDPSRIHPRSIQIHPRSIRDPPNPPNSTQRSINNPSTIHQLFPIKNPSKYRWKPTLNYNIRSGPITGPDAKIQINQ